MSLISYKWEKEKLLGKAFGKKKSSQAVSYYIGIKALIDYISKEGRGLLVLASIPLFNLVRLGYNFRSHVSSRRATVFLLFLLGGKHSQPRDRTGLQEVVWNLISLWLSTCSVMSGIECDFSGWLNACSTDLTLLKCNSKVYIWGNAIGGPVLVPGSSHFF